MIAMGGRLAPIPSARAPTTSAVLTSGSTSSLLRVAPTRQRQGMVVMPGPAGTHQWGRGQEEGKGWETGKCRVGWAREPWSGLGGYTRAVMLENMHARGRGQQEGMTDRQGGG